jgi:hypothetical protein
LDDSLPGIEKWSMNYPLSCTIENINPSTLTNWFTINDEYRHGILDDLASFYFHR